MSDELVFKAEDFEQRTGQTWRDEGRNCAELANAKFKSWLERQQKVYGADFGCNGTRWFTEPVDESWDNRVTAYLVGVKAIDKPDSAESLLKGIVTWWTDVSSDGSDLKKLIERAKQLLEQTK